VTYPVVSRGRPGYPALLAELHDPPPRLYLRGGPPELLARPSVAVVGARSCSSYGAQVARDLARELGAAGVVVVSGLARGVDGEAHRGALAGGGLTVAVLGCGIDRDYPRAHSELARRIADSGAIVSEYPPGTEPSPWRFPARNRIVAGLARATVVVEARERSGALITADFALELGREVFAVPGEITSALSAGTNDLIRQGATPLLSADDVLDALGLERPPPPPRAPDSLSAGARAALGRLSESTASLDELARASGLGSSAVAVALTELELAGLVTVADGVYRSTIGGLSMA
jgi:DNA processing protein